MANTVIQLRKSSTPSATPADLANGEIAINYADGKLFYKDSSGSIQQISSGGNTFSTVNAAGTLLVSDLPTDILNIVAGDNIEISADALTDTFTITANLSNVSGAASVTTSDTAPVSPSDGDLWYNTTIGKILVYYDDGSSSQWVEATTGQIYSDAIISSGAFDKANSANVLAKAAFDKANTASTNTFATINVAGQIDVTATSAMETLVLSTDGTINITTNSTTKTVTFALANTEDYGLITGAVTLTDDYGSIA